jgi:hypothetical protein
VDTLIRNEGSVERLYDTNAASVWFRERGIKHSPSYLRKLRTIGNGPVYCLFNGRPHYTEPGMAQYAQERTSPLARSSAEHANAGHRRQIEH